MKKNEAKNLVGCCGLYCGLCNKYQSTAPSRCVGCRLGEQHAWCSIWNCCVKKRGLETCAECNEIFRCEIFLRRKVSDWVPAAENLRQIKKKGFERWLQDQQKRQRLLEKLLKEYNEGRSMSFYCKACSRMPIDVIEKTIAETKEEIKRTKVKKTVVKAKSSIAKVVIENLASQMKIDLT